ncbi:MAG: glutamate 5-kinase [Phycisphaeraceae bacterium]|nr:MAG: glutamate 5-kinase [Phycisphaeraceae bacterium]
MTSATTPNPQPDDADRRSWLASVRRIVVKVGSRVLVDESNGLDEAHIAELVRQIAAVRESGREVALVSSGAIAAGLPALGLKRRPRDLPSLQAAAALGQARLIELYRDLFAVRGVAVGQVLLTHDDMRSRERHLNARNTLNRLLEAGAVPIVNENDTVAVDEIRVGDNDRLGALVGHLVRADLVIILSSIDGLHAAPPETGAPLVPRVTEITPEVRAMAKGKGSDVAVGGMATKLDAADMVMRAGEYMVIAHGREPDVLLRLMAGEALGTVFEPRPTRIGGRKRWIAFFERPAGKLFVDDGAAAALRKRGKSLLPAGVRTVEGMFKRGDVVSVVDESSAEIARGLVNYGADDLRLIAGRKTSEIERILGRREHDEVIHCDNMTLA